MAQLLISFLMLMTCFVAQAELPPEVQAAIVLAEASDKACENHKFRPFRENKIFKVGLEDYLKLTEICQAYSIGSTLRAVQNINKLEKQNFQNLGKLSADEKAKNIESRVFFFNHCIGEHTFDLSRGFNHRFKFRQICKRSG